MQLNVLLIGLALIQIFGFLPARVTAPEAKPAEITISNNQAIQAFPEKITFQADLQSSAEINQVWLEYGVDQLTCGKLIAKSVPDFQPGIRVSAQWVWEMKQSGSLPPGARIWWRWHAKDSTGGSLATEKQAITWLDQQHAWNTLTQGSIALHWYQGDQFYAQELLDNAVQSLEMLDKTVGLKPDGVIDLYIYATAQELTDAVYFMPDWTGGLAYSDNNIILIGIAEDDMVWGKHAETHELTHILVGRKTFSCLGGLPTWLNEGLAKYSEGEWDEHAQKRLKDAIASDDIMSVRSLSSSFPEDSKKADLAYTQSQSLVSFLIAKYQQEKILALLDLLRQGTAIDPALKQIYGFDQDGLEDAWRAEMNASPRASAQAAPTQALTPSPVPTIVPISGVPPVLTLSPPRTPSAADHQPTDVVLQPQARPMPNWMGVSILLVGGSLLCLVPVLLAGAGIFYFSKKGRKG